jgi:hypothetical protein
MMVLDGLGSEADHTRMSAPRASGQKYSLANLVCRNVVRASPRKSRCLAIVHQGDGA